MITPMWFVATLTLAQPAHTANFDYGGLPTLSNASIAMQAANVTFKLAGQTATTNELIVFKNTSQSPVDATLVVPRFRCGGSAGDFPTFPVSATWNKTTMTLADGSPSKADAALTFSKPVTSAVHFGPGETAALRIQYSTSFGSAGYGSNQSVVGFFMTGPQAAVPQVNVSFSYNQRTVFDLPTVLPSWQWQIGKTGSAIRLSNFAPQGQLVTAEFYGGGFHSIH
jgi:hypothetical protein